MRFLTNVRLKNAKIFIYPSYKDIQKYLNKRESIRLIIDKKDIKLYEKFGYTVKLRVTFTKFFIPLFYYYLIAN